MRTISSLIAPTLLLLLTTCMQPLLFASGGNDHTHGNETPTATKQTEQAFSSEAVSDKYELLIRYQHIHVGEPAHLTLFVSEYTTNKPINNADIKITAQEDSNLVFDIKQTAEGTYTLETVFPEKRKYALAVSINSTAGPDLILVTGIETEKEPAQPEVAVQNQHATANWHLYVAIVVALLIGLGLGILLQKRNTKQGKNTIVVLLLFINSLLPVAHTKAHGDDDHGAAQQTGNHFSNSFNVPKETQFLFEVFTQKVLKGSFTESTKLFGTIMPSSKGHATITTPQSGKITSLKVGVGEQVKAGQQVAVVEQNIDAVSQVNTLAEKNNLTAEYEAAKKEFNRLQTIKDIAARREVDEAASRLQKAETNLKLFTSNTAKTIALYAPIGGVVANFNLSVGATVNAGQTLFTITNLATVYAEAQVFDKDVAKVQEGNRFTVECANDSHKTSEVTLLSLAQEINTTNQSQRVLFQLNNPHNDFKPGEFVNIRVFAPQNLQQIALPNTAITELNGKPVVFVKEAAEQYTILYVQLGQNNGTHTSILKGIEETARVVVNGSYQLKMIYLNQ